MEEADTREGRVFWASFHLSSCVEWPEGTEGAVLPTVFPTLQLMRSSDQLLPHPDCSLSTHRSPFCTPTVVPGTRTQPQPLLSDFHGGEVQKSPWNPAIMEAGRWGEERKLFLEGVTSAAGAES